MDDVKKKVYLDIFASPGTLIPIAAGLTALMTSWAMGGNEILNFAGISGMLAGIGVTATRLVLGLESITRDAYDHVLRRQQHEQEESLERLHKRLLEDQDSRTQHGLRELRSLSSQLRSKVDEGQVNAAAYQVIEGVDRLFQTCVKQLEYSVELWETAQAMRGTGRDRVLQQRDELVQEVVETVDHLRMTVERFHAMTTHKNRSELARLRRELDQSMQVAREVERRTEELTHTRPPNTSEFE